MAFDILAHLPVEKRNAIRRKIAAETREAARLYDLPDRWLGEALLKLVRQVRAASARYATPTLGTYNDSCLWAVVPEIARRLGCSPDANETNALQGRTGEGAPHTYLPGLSPEEFREHAACTLNNLQASYLSPVVPTTSDLDPVSFLTRVAANGNPIAIALDRIAAPKDPRADPIARELLEVSAARGFSPRQDWSPELQRNFG